MTFALLATLLRPATSAALDFTQVEEMSALPAAQLFPNVFNARQIPSAQYVLQATMESFAKYVLQLIMNLVAHPLPAIHASVLSLIAISAQIMSPALNAWSALLEVLVPLAIQAMLPPTVTPALLDSIKLQ